MYNLNMSVPTCCYCLTVVFLNAKVLRKYILFQFCNVFLLSLYYGNCVASKGLCCPGSTTDRKLVLSVNKEPLLLTQLSNLLGLVLSDATNIGIFEKLSRQLKMLCSAENQMCKLSLQVQVSLLAAARNVFTLLLWKQILILKIVTTGSFFYDNFTCFLYVVEKINPR